MPVVHDIPALNATLNGLAALLITAGFICIRTGRRTAHRALMLSAGVVSALFLVGYSIHHYRQHGMHTPFGGEGAVRVLYLIILWTHIPLAAAIAYLVPKTFSLALRGDFERHKAWARIVFPIWYYVSVTGVLVYLFLYVWWPAPAR